MTEAKELFCNYWRSGDYGYLLPLADYLDEREIVPDLAEYIRVVILSVEAFEPKLEKAQEDLLRSLADQLPSPVFDCRCRRCLSVFGTPQRFWVVECLDRWAAELSAKEQRGWQKLYDRHGKKVLQSTKFLPFWALGNSELKKIRFACREQPTDLPDDIFLATVRKTARSLSRRFWI